MKTLFVMRHAKSDWAESGGGDFDRPLNDRGRRDLPRLARLFDSCAVYPDQIIASPAARARQTAEGIARTPESIRFEEKLYLAAPDTLMSILHETAEVDSALVVAHNPGVEDWLSELCGAQLRMATAALACLHLDLKRWNAVQPGCAQLQWFVIPRLLKGLDESSSST